MKSESTRALLLLPVVLAGILLAMCGVAELFLHDELKDRRAYDRVRLRDSAEALDRSFGRPADCTFLVDTFEVRYYLNRGYNPARMGPGHGCVAGPPRRTDWASLPGSMYCAAFFVVDARGRVVARELLGEGSLEKTDDSGLPAGFSIPCC